MNLPIEPPELLLRGVSSWAARSGSVRFLHIRRAPASATDPVEDRLGLDISAVTMMGLPGLRRRPAPHRLEDLCGVGVLNESDNMAVANGP